MSEVAMCMRCNATALLSQVSVAVLFASPSVGITPVWSHCWTYLLNGDRMGQDNRCMW